MKIDPLSYRPAPKCPRENIAYRRAVLERARRDEEFRAACWARAARDPVWYVDTFGWTYNPDCEGTKNRPMILYDYQEDLLLRHLRAVGKHDMSIEKARKMGATWVLMFAVNWLYTFHDSQSILLGSNKEDNVDMPGNPASLFGKLDYVNEKMPGWLRARSKRSSLKYVNLENDSVVIGESTNDNFSRSGRYVLIVMDEFAAVERGEKLLSATQATSKTRWFISTHQGVNTTFYELTEKMKRESPERVIRAHWSLHPEYRVGLYTSEEGPDKIYRMKKLDERYEYPADYKFIVDGKLRSPWYDEECRRSPNEQIIAQELDIQPTSGSVCLMNPDKLNAIIARSAKPSTAYGELVFDAGAVNPKFQEQSYGRLRLWIELDKNGLPPEAKYQVGADICMGTGGDDSSNSVASVVNKDTGSKVAEFASSSIDPHDFADYCVALCRLFDEANLIWETTGPGAQFTKRLRELGYRHLYRRWSDETGVDRRKVEKFGWHPTKETKRAMLDNYAYALQNGFFENPSIEALREVSEYERMPNGEITHVRSERSHNPNATGENHGDRVIADGLCCLAMGDVGRVSREQKLMADPPVNSPLWRYLESQRKIKTATKY